MLDYFLKFAISISLFYLFYQVVLRRLTFYGLNRLYLIGYTMLSFFIPFINISLWIDESNAIAESIPEIRQLTLNQVQVEETSGFQLLQWVIGAGILFMLGRWLVQYLSLQQVKQKASRTCHDRFTFYDVDACINPFSFGTGIFFNSRLHSEDELKKIIQHEFVHVRQHHTADLLLAELVCILNWWNPFAWMLRKAIRENLEFLADEQVLNNGVPAKEYQYLLLKVTGGRNYSIANQLHFSSLKKRITMMNKLKSARVHLIRFLFVLPVLSLLLLAFRQGVHRDTAFAEAIVAGNDVSIQDTVPTPPLPPQPPAPPKPPSASADEATEAVSAPLPPSQKMPSGVNSINIRNNNATVKLKNGKTESYDLNNSTERALFEEKYGNIPPPPPSIKPKPALPAKPARESDQPAVAAISMVVNEPVAVTTSVNANVVAAITAPEKTVTVNVESKPRAKAKASVHAVGKQVKVVEKTDVNIVESIEVKIDEEAKPVVPSNNKPQNEKIKPSKPSGKNSSSGQDLWPAGFSWAPVKDKC